MKGLLPRAPCGAALVAVLLMQPVVVTLCAAACGREVSGAGREATTDPESHCGGAGNGSEADTRPCGGHAKIHSAVGTAPRKASCFSGRDALAVLLSPACAAKLEVLQSIIRPLPVSHPAHAPPSRSVLRL